MCLLLSCHTEGIHNSGIGAVAAVMAVATCQGSIWNAQIMAGLYTIWYVQVCTLEEYYHHRKLYATLCVARL